MKRSVKGLAASALILQCVAAWPVSAQSANNSNAEPVRGIVRAQDEAWLSSDLALPVKSLPFKESASFHKGELLISFDCATLDAQQKAAQARVRAEEIGYKNNQVLKSHNAVGQYDVDVSKAKVDEAQANLAGIDANLARCNLTAPFDGQIAQLGVHEHETPERGARLMQILDSSNLEIDMIVPSDWLQWLKQGSELKILIDELNRPTTATIVRIAAQVDPVSQTVKVVGRITAGGEGVRPGMSGAITFQDSQ